MLYTLPKHTYFYEKSKSTKVGYLTRGVANGFLTYFSLDRQILFCGLKTIYELWIPWRAIHIFVRPLAAHFSLFVYQKQIKKVVDHQLIKRLTFDTWCVMLLHDTAPRRSEYCVSLVGGEVRKLVSQGEGLG